MVMPTSFKLVCKKSIVQKSSVSFSFLSLPYTSLATCHANACLGVVMASQSPLQWGKGDRSPKAMSFLLPQGEGMPDSPSRWRSGSLCPHWHFSPPYAEGMSAARCWAEQGEEPASSGLCPPALGATL